MYFKYCKKRLAIWASNSQVMSFLRLLIFCWYATFDWSSTNRTKQIVTHFFFIPNFYLFIYFYFFIYFLFFFVLDFNLDHSRPMRLSFCHGLPTLQTQNLTFFQQSFSIISRAWWAWMQITVNWNIWVKVIITILWWSPWMDFILKLWKSKISLQPLISQTIVSSGRFQSQLESLNHSRGLTFCTITFIGHMPPSSGNLRNLEWLGLSSNMLTREILG